MNYEEHIASLHAFWSAEHDERIAETREWAERAEAEGRTAAARQWRESVAELEAMDRPWESKQRAA